MSCIISKIENEFFVNGIFVEKAAYNTALILLPLSILMLSQTLTKSIHINLSYAFRSSRYARLPKFFIPIRIDFCFRFYKLTINFPSISHLSYPEPSTFWNLYMRIGYQIEWSFISLNGSFINFAINCNKIFQFFTTLQNLKKRRVSLLETD